MSIAIIDTRKTAPRPAATVGAGPTAARLPPVDVMVVDDDRDASYSLCALLWWRPGIRVATATSADVPDVVLLQRPAVCLVSAELGPCFMYRFHELPRGPRVLAYTDDQGSELDGEAVLAGAAGSVWRYGDPDELADTIRLVAAGGKAFPALAPETIDRLIDQVEDRDRPIAALLLLDTPLDEIARILGISARAAVSRRQRIIKRLDPTAADHGLTERAGTSSPLRTNPQQHAGCG
jgi:DNA-binding NarL/FixJ family response regulator